MGPYRSLPEEDRTMVQRAKGLVCEVVGHAPIDITVERSERPIPMIVRGFESERRMTGSEVTDLIRGKCERCGAHCERTEVHYRTD